MRLTRQEVGAIEAAFASVFETGEVFLFGSRVDDAKKGGDIDLYIRPSPLFEDVFAKKIDFLVTLKQVIGEQKVDVLIEPRVPDSFRQEVMRSGLLLCKR
ncbi:nucleotidyltransferase domain-containing protein [Marinomonas shanghaiensis]|uniref:nucleotidyltransferase domain-containing protein n=1 Tax=Marinomonas shanghaiensis TaxID=2202418 RepID=UPI003A8DCF74